MKTDRVVLFDWDGTLIDSLDTKVRNASILFQEVLGFDRRAAASAYRRYSGIPRRQLFEAICRENGLTDLPEERFQFLSQRFSELNLAEFTDGRATHLVPDDTPTALSELQAQGYPLYISSSAVAEEIRLVAHLHHLDGYFQEILGSAPGFNKGPEHVVYVMERQNVSRRQIVFVGDEPSDIALGKSAGVYVVAKAGTYPPERLEAEGADRVIASLREIPDLLKTNLSVQ
jgi:phosphoglycolate phosphatase-like HAD superfamily hydrolase